MVDGCLSMSLLSNGLSICLFESKLVAGCLLLSLKSHVLAACLSLSVLVAGYLSLSLLFQLSRCMSLTVSIGGWLSITFHPSDIVLLHVSHCSNGCWLSLTVSLVPWSYCMSLTVSYCYWMSLIVSPSTMEFLNVSHCLLWLLAVSLSLRSHGVYTYLSLFLPFPSSCCMSLTVSYGFWLSHTVSLVTLQFLHVSHCFLWLLACSHCLFGPMELLHVSHCLLLLLVFSHCLSQYHGVSACLSLSPMVDGCISRPMELLHVCMSLT